MPAAVVDEMTKREESEGETGESCRSGTEFGRIGRDRAAACLQEVGDPGDPRRRIKPGRRSNAAGRCGATQSVGHC